MKRYKYIREEEPDYALQESPDGDLVDYDDYIAERAKDKDKLYVAKKALEFYESKKHYYTDDGLEIVWDYGETAHEALSRIVEIENG
jgi:hypothetical protein